MEQQGDGGKPNDHNWVMSRDRKHVTCAKGPGGQSVIKLWEAEELTEFHDVDLARVTKEINAIVEKVEKNNKDPNRVLSLIEFQGRHLMVWATYGAVTPYDADDTIMKALKVKTK